jgi:hypothetical protein
MLARDQRLLTPWILASAFATLRRDRPWLLSLIPRPLGSIDDRDRFHLGYNLLETRVGA